MFPRCYISPPETLWEDDFQVEYVFFRSGGGKKPEATPSHDFVETCFCWFFTELLLGNLNIGPEKVGFPIGLDPFSRGPGSTYTTGQVKSTNMDKWDNDQAVL